VPVNYTDSLESLAARPVTNPRRIVETQSVLSGQAGFLSLYQVEGRALAHIASHGVAP
jgi:hypothetical protein